MVSRPSDSALSKWYMAQPEREYTCSDCGRIGPRHAVQPQHPFYAEGREGIARCPDCIAAINRRITVERKAMLAAEPRCEVDGCKRRGNWRVAGNVLMCGYHLKRARHKAQSFGWLAMTIHDRETVLSLAKAECHDHA